MYQPPKPETAGSRVSGVRNLELVKSMCFSINLIVNQIDLISPNSPKFRVPDTRTPKPETAGSRVSGVRNSELWRIWGDQFNLIHNQTYRVPSSGHPIPETRQSRVSGFGCPEFETRSEFRTPETRDPAVSGFGFRGSGFGGWYISVWGLALKI
ncbi:hypothetical protein EV424DRAFT_1351952 [Suillus variegatus]|nr:hypothetical protein EV424DRAFT_1351952 [Suillus variegatus]